jgi:hypothetical protein
MKHWDFSAKAATRTDRRAKSLCWRPPSYEKELRGLKTPSDQPKWSGRRDSNPRRSPWQGAAFRPHGPHFSAGVIFCSASFQASTPSTRVEERSTNGLVTKVRLQKNCLSSGLELTSDPLRHGFCIAQRSRKGGCCAM